MPNREMLLQQMSTIEKAIRFHKLMENKALSKGKPKIAVVSRRARKQIVRELARLDQVLEETRKC